MKCYHICNVDYFRIQASSNLHYIFNYCFTIIIKSNVFFFQYLLFLCSYILLLYKQDITNQTWNSFILFIQKFPNNPHIRDYSIMIRVYVQTYTNTHLHQRHFICISTAVLQTSSISQYCSLPQLYFLLLYYITALFSIYFAFYYI